MAKVMLNERIIEILKALGIDITGDIVTEVTIKFSVGVAPTVSLKRYMLECPIDFLKLQEFKIVDKRPSFGNDDG